MRKHDEKQEKTNDAIFRNTEPSMISNDLKKRMYNT